jgi:6-phosphofructokinase 1
VGRAAVAAAINGVSRVMMGIQRVSTEPYATEIDYSDISKIANMIREVPSEFINAEGNNVTDECARYLLPLIEGNTEPEWKNGLPVYCII